MEHDWNTDEKWKAKLANIYPTPPTDRLERMKRKFYKEAHDPDFDVDFQEPQARMDANNANAGGSSEAPSGSAR